MPVVVAALLLTTLLLALTIAIAATPNLEQKLPMPIMKRRSLLKHDVVERTGNRHRSNYLTRSPPDGSDSNSTNTPRRSNISAYFDVRSFYVHVPMGDYLDPEAYAYRLIINISSSVTWVGASKKHPYVKTSTSRQTNNRVILNYSDGNTANGIQVFDQLVIGSFILNQSIGVMNSSGVTANFLNEGIDGVLGVGPVKGTIGTLFNGDKQINDSIPTVSENLLTSGAINQSTLFLYFPPSSADDLDRAVGEVGWGPVDQTKFIGDIIYANASTKYPWGINLSAMSYGETSLPSQSGDTSASAVLNTVTPFILLAPKAYKTYVAATGAVVDNTSGLLSVTYDQFKSLKSLSFTFSGVNLTIAPGAQVLPKNLNTYFKNGSLNNILLNVGPLDSNEFNLPVDAILGLAFFRGFFTVLDFGKNRVGFAETNSTFNTTVNTINIIPPLPTNVEH